MTIKVLGIESSCDDTSVAIVDSDNNILSNIVISQNDLHQPYQGVVPEIAARAHLDNLDIALERCFLEASIPISLKDIDAVAATSGPGLISGVIVGSMFGKALASVLQKDFIAVNHLEGHALMPALTDNLEFPYLLLLITGGHCQFIAALSLGKYKILGSTLDDAVGEVFDKVAKMMNLPFPGGPIIEKLAKKGDPNRFIFPRPLYHRKNADMSFSGLKTAVKLHIQKISPLTQQDICDISASFQQTISEILVKKIEYALPIYESYNTGKDALRNIVLSGGVAANMTIRDAVAQIADKYGYRFIAPPIKYCTDNGAMIAFAGLQRLKAGIIDDVGFCPRARWSLEDLSSG